MPFLASDLLSTLYAFACKLFGPDFRAKVMFLCAWIDLTLYFSSL